MSGPNSRDPFSLPESLIDLATVDLINLAGVKIGYTPDMGGFPVEPEVASIVEDALKIFKTAGAIVEEVKVHLPASPLELSHLWVRLMALLYTDAFVGFKSMGYDLLESHGDSLTPNFRDRLLEVNSRSALDTLDDQRMRTRVYDAIIDAFDNYDFLISPTLAMSPVKNLAHGLTTVPKEINGIEIEPTIGWCLTFPINFTGHPAASIPCGFTTGNLPVGMQIIGKRHADDDVLALSKAFETLAPWIDRYPRR